MVGLLRARWLGAVLIAPVLAFAVAASSYLALRCTVTGLMMADDGCPSVAGGGSSERPMAHSSIGDPVCCERLVVATGKALAVVSDRSLAQPVVTADLAKTSVVSLLPPAPRSRGFAPHLARPPGTTAPHFLLAHSFLI